MGVAALASRLLSEGRRRGGARVLLLHTAAGGPPPPRSQARAFSSSSSSGDDDGKPKRPRRRFEAGAGAAGLSLKAFIRRAQVLALYRSFLRVSAFGRGWMDGLVVHKFHSSSVGSAWVDRWVRSG